MKKHLLLLLACSLATYLNAQQIWYVNQNASGNNTGASWTDAFIDLQDGLSIAEHGDQIWVAIGTYHPTNSLDRNISFNLPNGIRLYGGFSGNETTLDQRNPETNITILSGEIGEPDLAEDNSYHVLTIYQGDANTILDGFLIKDGYGDHTFSGFPNEYGGGVLVAADASWPLAEPIISHCRFERNRAGSGGGLACIGNDGSICSPIIRQCSFLRNLGEYYGGALYKSGKNRSDAAFCISDCSFEDNRASLGGGLTIYEPSDTVRILHCSFSRDTATEAGGVYLWSGSQNVRYEIEGCDFTANHVNNSSGGGLEHFFAGYTPVEKIELIVRKSTFFLNKSGIGGGIASYLLSDLGLHRFQVEECLFESNQSQNGGAGILIDAGSRVYTEASVDRCYFLGNQTGASSVASAFYYRGYGNDLIRNQNTITNSVFMFNDGAVASLGGNPGITYTRIANCSFYRNGEIPFVKYWGLDSNPVDLVMKMQILNSVLWEPQTVGVHRLFYNNDPVNFTVHDYFVDHSLVHLSNCIYDGVDPCGAGMIYGQWPNFIDSSGQLGLITADFSGRNRGSNSVVDTLGLVQDYLGTPRIYCDTVDIGAYEIHGLCTSALNEPHFTSLPVGIHVLQNPILKGHPIEVELFAAIPENLLIKLIDGNARVVWEGNISIQAALPSIISIPSNDTSPGLFYLQFTDDKGRFNVEKVSIF